jgi:type II secretory pathway component PulF
MEKVFRREGDGRAGILSDIMKRLHDGKPLSEALRPWVASHEAQMLGSISRGVDLGTALRNAAALTQSRQRIVGAITGSMTYPAVLLMVGTGMLLVFSTQVIPTLAQLIPVGKWTGLGLFYHGLSTLVQDHGLAILAVTVVSGVASVWSLPRWKPDPVRRWLDGHLPPWNLYRVYQGAIVLVTVSIMMRSGVAMGDAVQILWDNNQAAWVRA